MTARLCRAAARYLERRLGLAECQGGTGQFAERFRGADDEFGSGQGEPSGQNGRVGDEGVNARHRS